MIDVFRLSQLRRDLPLKVKQGPAREAKCTISGCPVDEHSFAVRLPGAGLACASCAADHGFRLDWSEA